MKLDLSIDDIQHAIDSTWGESDKFMDLFYAKCSRCVDGRESTVCDGYITCRECKGSGRCYLIPSPFGKAVLDFIRRENY